MPDVVREQLAGFIATNVGETSVTVDLAASEGRVKITARWMGSEALEVVLLCQHHVHGTHSGALTVEGARRALTSDALPLPPSDGPIILEYVRLPAQPAPNAGSESMAMVGQWTDPFSMVLWLHREATIDDGTDLEPDEYDADPVAFRPVVDALEWLRRPWKLAEVVRDLDRA